MQIPKPSDVDKAFFASVVPDGPRVTIKPMFGNVAGFVNGNMFMGLFRSSLGLRFAPSDAERLLAIEGAGPFGPAERPMGGYVAYLTPGATTGPGSMSGSAGRSSTRHRCHPRRRRRPRRADSTALLDAVAPLGNAR